ncbi:uncharacterized protein LOC105686956 isoform X1 [Athalia rosae]|uniref:uncharacterized protein LOC105686956 isoform X1 n=2 Tax=Athalia rosae TaxID=37344 RepID=UPI002033E936|nr:uncharacterized protein LOC105686956 isoform X1 [Athalia rosae]
MSPQRRFTVFIIVILAVLASVEFVENHNSEIAEILHRPMRSLAYPSNSGMGLFFALAVPLNDPEHSISLSYFFEANYKLPDNATYYDAGYYGVRKRRSIDRTTVYRVLESKFESAGFPGRECLLRSICETSEWPIRHNGILGDVMHVILTPSSSQKEDLPREFSEAEEAGKNGTCTKFYPLCPMGVFDVIGTFIGF